MILQQFFSRGWGLVPLVISIVLQSNITVTQNQATPNFPDAISFHLEANSAAEIDSVALEVRTDALACGESATRVVPDDFQPGQSVAVDWTWELRRTGALPPGTTVWWQWAISAGGETVTTPEEQLVVVDDSREWEETRSDQVVLYWYEGSEDFAQRLLQAGQSTVDRLEEDLDTSVGEPIRMYVYADTDDMQEATLFAPDWSGGLAFTEYGALLMAVGPTDEAWGQRVASHEMTHIVVGRYTFSCVTSTPIWFEEGYAQISEGEPNEYYVAMLDHAVENNTLLSVRELGQIFSNDPDLASLSYAESQSLVTFLIEKYGEDKIRLLLDQFKAGTSEDRALMEVYGINRDELEAAWREWIGAAPMDDVPAEASATRTPYPTFVPIDEPPQAVSEVRPTPSYLATLAPEQEAEPPATEAAVSAPALSRGVIAVGIAAALCLGALLLAGAAIVVSLVARYKRQEKQTGE